MDFLRNQMEAYYLRNKRKEIFDRTSNDPEIAHHEFVKMAQRMNSWGLDELFLDCSENQMRPYVEISNAAGFNKNGDIPPKFLKYLGFDRVVVGTVTYSPWEGNPRPRIKRYPNTESIVNWMGLPGIGAAEVLRNLLSYGEHGVPITINVMATPQKNIDQIRDVQRTISITKDAPYVDRFELNISCPNTHSSAGVTDAREEHLRQLKPLVDAFVQRVKPSQKTYLKVSPDLLPEQIHVITEVAREYGITGIVATNTTTYHDPRYITSSPNVEKRGGASGAALYERATSIQRAFEKAVKGTQIQIIACGGIDSRKKLQERIESPAVNGIQLFTPLIYKGPRIIRRFRRQLSI